MYQASREGCTREATGPPPLSQSSLSTRLRTSFLMSLFGSGQIAGVRGDPRADGRAQPGRVLARRGAEQPAVLAVELGGAVVADQVPDRGHVAGAGDQERAGGLEPDALLELHRAHRGDGAEVPVERGRAHPR